MNDTIRFDCASCGKSLKAKAQLAGKSGKCPNCGASFNVPFIELAVDDDFIAPSNFAKPGTKYCHHCGSMIAALAEICPKCGVRQPSAPRYDGLSTVAPNGKSKLAAALFALFLGGFGIHKFYLGQVGWGVVYLLFCWTLIPTIAGFIEGIVLLVMSEPDFVRKYGTT